jgi:integrase
MQQSLRNTHLSIGSRFPQKSAILNISKPSSLLDSRTAICSIENIRKSESGQPSRPAEPLFGAFRQDDFSTRAEQLRREAMHDTPLSALPISEAGRIWLKEHSRYIKLRTFHDYEQYLKALGQFFTMPLSEIHIGVIRLYQDWRRQSAGAARINMELSTLQQILKEAKLWDEIAKFYRPLPISHRGSGQSITPEDEEKLLEIAFSSRRRTLAAHCLRIMLRTGVGFGELRRVRKRDIDLKERLIMIWDGAKNESRERTIPLTDQALESVNWILERFRYLGGEHGDEFILPHCSNRKNGPRDFSRPMGSIKKAFAGIRQDAVKEIGPHMARFRIYDCRTTAVTRSLSSGKVSIHTAEKLFGHSQAMTRRYYKPTMSVLREAVDVLERKKA